MPEYPVFEVDGEPLSSCPQALVAGEAMEAIEMHGWMERGFLPKAGGIDDQMESDLQKIMVVDNVRAQRNAKQDGR